MSTQQRQNNFNKDDISPEYIEKVRAIRKARHEKAKREEEERIRNNPDFIKRPILYLPRNKTRVPDSKNPEMKNVKIMTYNTLAQTLIRRTTFPDAHGAIKWHKRSKVLMEEINYYRADILCLQEVDKIQWEKFWLDELEEIGYRGRFFTFPGKVHGVAIAWNQNIFDIDPVDFKELMLDDYVAGDNIGTTTGTRSVALIVALKFKNSSNGIIMTTTHLFWHLFGTFERTRQCYIIMRELSFFRDRIIKSYKGIWYSFLTGDFNSQPCDPPYLSITEKPVNFKGRARAIIECSTAYKYSKKRNDVLKKRSPPVNASQNETDDHDEYEEDTDDEGEFIPNQPKEPRPYTYNASPDQTKLVDKLESLHNEISLVGVSLYGLAYDRVHPENSNKYTTNGEPELSHRALKWSGLLDYIFLIKPWKGQEKQTKDTIDYEIISQETHINVNGYLRLPRYSEMPSHTEPHEGEFPSDHLALMCDLSVEM